MNERFYFYILVAASAVGKSALLQQMRKENLWVSVPKYSTRDVRSVDDDVVAIDEVTIKSQSTQDNSKIRLSRIKRLKEMCCDGQGIVYYKNNNFYAIRISDILVALDSNNAVAIISDFQVIKKLKEDSRLEGRIKVLYIASTIDERELLKRYKSRENTVFDRTATTTHDAINKISHLCLVLGSAARLNYLDRIEEVMPLLNEESTLSSGIQKKGRIVYLSFSSIGGNTRTKAVISVVEERSSPP